MSYSQVSWRLNSDVVQKVKEIKHSMRNPDLDKKAITDEEAASALLRIGIAVIEIDPMLSSASIKSIISERISH